MRVARAGDPVEQAVGAVGLEVAADLVELLAAVADDLTGLACTAELDRKLEQGELASFSVRGWRCFTTPS